MNLRSDKDVETYLLKSLSDDNEKMSCYRQFNRVFTIKTLPLITPYVWCIAFAIHRELAVYSFVVYGLTPVAYCRVIGWGRCCCSTVFDFMLHWWPSHVVILMLFHFIVYYLFVSSEYEEYFLEMDKAKWNLRINFPWMVTCGV